MRVSRTGFFLKGAANEGPWYSKDKKKTNAQVLRYAQDDGLWPIYRCCS